MTYAIEFTREQYLQLPARVQKYLRMCGTEYPQGIGKPSIITLPQSRLAGLETLCKECGMMHLIGDK